MNEDLSKIILYYATKPHKELSELLLGKSKDNLISSLVDLLTAYINDKNSSSLREYITVIVSGYEHNPKKLGYNGFRQSSEIGGKPIACEAKPRNIQTDGYDLRKSKPKFNGDGGFNDYTIERHNKDIKENFNILSSGFVDGELLYVLEFPFRIISKRLKSQLPKKRIIGTYTRMASFNFSHYKNSKEVKIVYLNNRAIINNEKYFNSNFYNFLTKKINGGI